MGSDASVPEGLVSAVVDLGPGEPWRMLLLPQPEGICLAIRIDALGVHEIGLYTMDDALDGLTDWLPSGHPGEVDERTHPDDLLAVAERSALVTVTHYTAEGTAGVAGESTDLVLANVDGQRYVFGRDQTHSGRLVPEPERVDVHDRLVELLA